MGGGAARSKLTPAEYLEWEREQVDKHEYYAGEVFAMAGGSPRHNWIAGNVQSALKRAAGAASVVRRRMGEKRFVKTCALGLIDAVRLTMTRMLYSARPRSSRWR